MGSQETIQVGKLAFVTSANNEMHRRDLRNHPVAGEGIDVLNRLRRFSGNVDEYVAINSDKPSEPVQGFRRESAPQVASQPIDVFQAVGHIGPIFPHSGEGELSHGASSGSETVWREETHLDDGPFTDLDILKGLEDAVFVSCRNCHCRHLTYRSTGSRTALQPSWAMRPTAAVRKARGGMSGNAVPATQ